MSKVELYREARMACEVARNLLAAHDFADFVRTIKHAHAIGPIVDPTMYRAKSDAMDEDAKVFRAAAAFLAAWPKESADV